VHRLTRRLYTAPGTSFNFETILQTHDTAIRALVWSHNEDWLLSGAPPAPLTCSQLALTPARTRCAGDDGGVVKYWRTNMNNIKSLQAHKEPVRACVLRARAAAPVRRQRVTRPPRVSRRSGGWRSQART
jgi:hypothetical protein